MRVCKTCHIEQSEIEFYACPNRKDGLGTECKNCLKLYFRERNQLIEVKIRRRKWEREWNKKNPDYRKQKDARASRTVRGRFRRAKGVAKSRQHEWNLSIEQFGNLINFPCNYCGEPLSDTGGQLDRIDSSKGYNIENVVPCCLPCNKMKMDMNLEDFYKKVEQIHKHKKLKENHNARKSSKSS